MSFERPKEAECLYCLYFAFAMQAPRARKEGLHLSGRGLDLPSTALRRWTNGDGLVPMPDIHLTEAGPCLLEAEVAATPPYPLPATGGVKDARAA